MSSKTTHADKIQASREQWPGLDRTSPYVAEKEGSVVELLPMALPKEVLLEKEVCKALRTYWKKWGFFYIRNQQGLGSKRGTADYTIVRDGRTIFVEAKATKGKQGPHQIEFQTELEAAGGSYYMVHSLEEFIVKWKAG